MSNVYAYDLVPRKSNVWTPARNKQLLALLEQCGPTLCHKIIAMDLRLPGARGESMVIKRLRELKIQGEPL